MNLLAIGRLRSGPEADLFDRYNTRLRPRLSVTELPEARGTPAMVKRKECLALVGALPRDAFMVPLDLGGRAIGSEALAAELTRWCGLSRQLCFVIGGAEGLDEAVLARGDYILSLGEMTWPHFLVRAMLAEQLYRAQSVVRGHPYHRSGRPTI